MLVGWVAYTPAETSTHPETKYFRASAAQTSRVTRDAVRYLRARPDAPRYFREQSTRR